VSIAEGEVNGDVKLDLASSKYIFKESVSLVENECLKINYLVLALV